MTTYLLAVILTTWWAYYRKSPCWVVFIASIFLTPVSGWLIAYFSGAKEDEPEEYEYYTDQDQTPAEKDYSKMVKAQGMMMQGMIQLKKDMEEIKSRLKTGKKLN